MTNPCDTQPGWGSLPFGEGAWGGSTPGAALLPSYPPFDVFQLGPCGSFLTLPLYPEVTVTGDGQWTYDPATGGVRLQSGVLPTRRLPVQMEVVSLIPDQFTVEWALTLTQLPSGMGEVDYVRIGAGSSQGQAVELWLSQQGVGHLTAERGAIPEHTYPGSNLLLVEGGSYVIRVVVTADSVYVYITEAAACAVSGHVLQYVLPLSGMVLGVDAAWVEVAGGTEAVDVTVLSMGVSSKTLISNFPPTAIAGADQSVAYCSIVQLDGGGSYDNEGKTLTYRWRLVEAPTASGFCLDGLCGHAQPESPATGYTDKYYCSQLDSLAVGDISVGDVLVVQGQPYDILALGTDGTGSYIQITAATLPEDTAGAFKVFRQFGINQPFSVKASFYPDIPGFYRFTLTVSDGVNLSTPSPLMVSVVSTVRAQGVVPDATFMWEYLSSFWKLVEDKDRYTVVWSSMLQFCAGELLTLWQYEYSKSLQDIQRTFQRRWLDYDLGYLVQGDQTFRAFLTPYDTLPALRADTGLEGVRVLFAFMGKNIPVDFTAVPGGISIEMVATALRAALPTDCTVTVMEVVGDTTRAFLRICSQQLFSVTSTATGFFPTAASMLSGVRGVGGQVIWGGKGLQITGSFYGLGIQENDVLEYAGDTYRIMMVASSQAGAGDILILKDVLPDVGAIPAWSIPSYFRCASQAFYTQMVVPMDNVLVESRSSVASGAVYSVPAVGTCAADDTLLAVDATSILPLFTQGDAFRAYSVYRRQYVPVASVVYDIPTLQACVAECTEDQLLRRNLDFFIEEFRGSRCIRFDPSIWVHEGDNGTLLPDEFPPYTLWAETTYLDNSEAIENNFGKLAGLTAEEYKTIGAGTDYLAAVRGLWYAKLNGSRMDVLRIGAQVLLGLPLAEEEGRIEELRTDFSPTTGRVLVRDTGTVGVVRSYTFPRGLRMETNPATAKPYQVGDTVARFAPLVCGVEVVDSVSNPKWIDAYAVGGSAESIQRLFRFLVRVDRSAFNLAAIEFVRQFFLKVKPAYTYPIVVAAMEPQQGSIDVMDVLHWKTRISVFDTPHSGRNYASCWDQPEDGADGEGGVYKNAYDGTHEWAHDVTSPLDELWLKVSRAYASAFTPTVDSVFVDLSTTVYNAAAPTVPIVWDYSTQQAAGTYFRKQQV